MLNLFLSPHSVINIETSFFSARTSQSFFYIFNVCVENTNHLPLNSELWKHNFSHSLSPELKVNVLAGKYGSVFPLLFWVPDDVQLISIKFLFFSVSLIGYHKIIEFSFAETKGIFFLNHERVIQYTRTDTNSIMASSFLYDPFDLYDLYSS